MEDGYEQLAIAIDNLNYSDEDNQGDEPPPGYFIELDPIDEEKNLPIELWRPER